jgi:hypothetical protein
MPRRAGQPSLNGSAAFRALKFFCGELIQYWEVLTDVDNPTNDNLRKIHEFLKNFNRKVDLLIEQLEELHGADECCGRFRQVMEEIKTTFEECDCLSDLITYYQLSQETPLKLTREDIKLRVEVGKTLEKLSEPLRKALSQECIQSKNTPLKGQNKRRA